MTLSFLNVPGCRSRATRAVSALAAAIVAVSTAVLPAVAQEQAPPAADVAQPSQPPAAPEAPPALEQPTAQPAEQSAPPSTSVEPSAAPVESPSAPETGPDQPAAAPSVAPPSDSADQPSAPDATGDAATAAPEPQASGELPAAKAPHLPHDLSPWGMFMAADIVVKAVMIGLAFASVVTWTVWLAKSLELTWAKRRVTQAFARIRTASSLAEAVQRLQGQRGIVLGLIENAALELGLSADVSDKDGIKERVSSRLEGLVSAAGRDMNRGTGVLATIGSTAPFVGLFGTVWGIMNSFIGISEAQTTNLAVVAPGIAEALLATAMGLVAAIPAVIIYNHFARQIGGYRAMIGEASAEVMRLVSRDLDRGLKIARARAAE